MAVDLPQNLMAAAGMNATVDCVTIEGGQSLLNTPLRAAELSAAVLAAQAALICKIWQMRTGRQQTAAIDREGAALALQSVFYQRQWSHPIMLTEPSYPTVSLYETADRRWVTINGGYPKLRDGLLDMLSCANSAGAVRAAVARWEAAELEDEAARRGLCAAVVRTPEAWRSHPQGRALADAGIVEIEKIADGPPVPFPATSTATPPTGVRPLTGQAV